MVFNVLGGEDKIIFGDKFKGSIFVGVVFGVVGGFICKFKFKWF